MIDEKCPATKVDPARLENIKGIALNYIFDIGLDGCNAPATVEVEDNPP